MELPRQGSSAVLTQVDKYILAKSWSSHDKIWLNERARQHTAIFDITLDGRLYSSHIDIPKMMLRCKAEYEVNFRTHTGSRTLAYSSFKGDYILEDYLSNMPNVQLRQNT